MSRTLASTSALTAPAARAASFWTGNAGERPHPARDGRTPPPLRFAAAVGIHLTRMVIVFAKTGGSNVFGVPPGPAEGSAVGGSR
jgi:hypothetical protein